MGDHSGECHNTNRGAAENQKAKARTIARLWEHKIWFAGMLRNVLQIACVLEDIRDGIAWYRTCIIGAHGLSDQSGISSISSTTCNVLYPG